MAFIRNRLYGFSAPLLLLPLMRVQLDNLPAYLQDLKPQFQQIVAELIVARLSSIAEALFLALTRLFFPG